jgi:hypothetical protein
MYKPRMAENFAKLKAFFDRDVAQRATKPLREGVELAIYINGAGPYTISRHAGRTSVINTPPAKPDMSFWLASEGVDRLSSLTTDDIGEIGIEICKLMMSPDPNLKIKAKVHIGTFDLLRNGYLGVLPLGGASLMKFLASNGFSGIGKVKDAISKMRG